MAFHRLVTPTYFGGLPGGYDYINTPSLNGDPGSPAPMDGKKGSGTNQGTYLVAFGEDATANNTNRGLQALAQNTDAIDDLLRRDLALTSRTADVTAGAPVSSIVLAGQTYVGDFGVANNQATRDLLVSILDNNDNEIITTAGTVVKALLIHDGASNNVVGTQTSGFYSGPTVALNVAIPAGVTYRVYYGTRSNLATLPKDAFTNIKIRGAQEVSGEVERVLRDLHAASGATWNDPWLATINSLARTGLDGRYRLASISDPGGGTTMDTPGNGGFITRDGTSIKLRAPTYLLGSIGTVGIDAYVDPLLAMLKLERVSTQNGTAFDLSRGGDVGLYQESPVHNTVDVAEVSQSHVTGALLMDIVPRAITGSTLGGGAALTRINPSAVGTVNPDALTDTLSRRTVQVGGSDFVKDGSSRTGLRKTDLIEVTNNVTGQVVGIFRVDSIQSPTRIALKALTGANPPLGPSGASAAVRLRWLQPTVSIGGTHRAATDAQGTPHFMVAAPGLLTSTYDGNTIVPYAAFLAASSRRDIGITNLNLLEALAWGGFDLDGTIAYKGRFYGDGGMVITGGKQRLCMIGLQQQRFSVPDGGGTVLWDPLQGGQLVIQPTTTWPTNPSTIILTIDTSKGYVAEAGDKFSLDIIIPNVTPAVVMTWPGNFKFSDGDDILPLATPSGQTVVVHYDFTYMTYTSPVNVAAWYARRTDYAF